MELRHLRYFLAVAEEMNFTRAAARLAIAQPPLSRQIQELEEELGAPLFIRKPRALQLTDEGILFRQYAIRVLELVDQSAEEVREMKHGLHGMLSLATVEGHAPRLLSQWIAEFHEIHPDVQYNLWNGNSDDVSYRISKGICELGIIAEPYNAEGLNAIHVYKEPWIAMIPKNHPLAGLPGDTISLSKLAPYELLLPSRISRLQEITDWFGSSGQNLTVCCRIAHMLNAYELTKRGVGIAIYPAAAGELAGSDEISLKRLVDPEVTVSYVLVWDKQRQLSHAAQAFVDYVKQHHSLD